MNIEIYQIDIDKDVDRVAFMGTWMLERKSVRQINFSIYDLVYKCSTNCRNLEDVYEMFNLNHPEDFRGHSLSVSDIVKVTGYQDIEDGHYFCDTFGWKRLDENFNY